MKRPAANGGLAKRQRLLPEKLPVSTLSGFLGAGKTTLLKHILESKRKGDDAFRCAVIVNDMAELNIDKSLIDQSELVQSDDVIAMQNGCVCCTLQNDLVGQIIGLAKKKTFDYMILEASGVSEPANIARLFAECDEDHDHDDEHGQSESLATFASLDTCVTVVDAADFFAKFQTIKQGPKDESFPHLMVEQIEYANVIVLNKSDLVDQAQLSKISEQVSILNPGAKLLTARNSSIDVAKVVNSGLYKAADFATFHVDEAAPEEELKDCCQASLAKGGMACCRRARTRESAKSKVVLGYTGPKLDKTSGKTRSLRHASRFRITSFIYQARRPFHPNRFDEEFVKRFFIMKDQSDDEGDAESKKGQRKGKKVSKEEQRKVDAKRDAAVRKQQKAANAKNKARAEKMGDLFRSKGFLWLANRHDLMGVLSHASSVMSIEFPDRWTVLQSKAWEGEEEVKAKARKEWVEPWGDRRQDLVFIGKDLKEEVIQEILDNCLLTDDEMAMGADGWKAVFGDVLLDNADDSSDDGGE